MKLTQFLSSIVVVAVIVGGAAFVIQYTSGGAKKEAPVPVAPPTNAKLLNFVGEPSTDAEGRALFSVYLPDEVEVNKPGRCDFPFENTTDEPLEMGLQLKGCTCQTVDALLATPADLKKIPEWPPKIINRTGADAIVGKHAPWKRLEEAASLTVPPGAKGFVRLGWSTAHMKPVRLKAAIWTHPPKETTKDLTILEVAVNIVAGIQVYPSQLVLKPVDLGDTESTSCWCWSSTRDSFVLSPRLEHPNSAIHFSMKPLTLSEREELHTRDSNERPTESRTQVRCGYKVTVEIRNDPSKPPLDLGPFDETVHLDCQEPGVGAVFQLAGAVKGLLHVVSTEIRGEPQRDYFLLQRFPVALGVTKEFAVEADQPDIDLDLDSWSPSYLKVDIRKDSAPGEIAHWMVRVTVPPNVESGRLPRGSHVLFRTRDKPARRIRVPVYGNAVKEP